MHSSRSSDSASNQLVFRHKNYKILILIHEDFSMIPFYPSRYLSHAMIVFMVVVSLVGFADNRIIQIFGFHFSGLSVDAMPSLISSTLLFQFLHWGPFHLLMNSLFLYQAWPEMESRMSRQNFIRFFIGSTLFVAVALVLFSNGLTIGMSGFCMALLAYLWIDLYTTRHPMSNQILIMLAFNVGIGLMPGISLVWHLFGAIWGLVWWKFFKTWKR